jgi:hypothetical protein
VVPPPGGSSPPPQGGSIPSGGLPPIGGLFDSVPRNPAGDVAPGGVPGPPSSGIPSFVAPFIPPSSVGPPSTSVSPPSGASSSPSLSRWVLSSSRCLYCAWCCGFCPVSSIEMCIALLSVGSSASGSRVQGVRLGSQTPSS